MDILVVDDDLTTRKMLRFVLEQQAGHRVVEAEDGETAQRHIDADRFDLVMVDVVMPGIDGLELCKRIRATSNVPIMVVSARGDIQSRVRGLQLGADDYLPKPFDPSELAARVEAVLRRTCRSARTDSDGRMRMGDLTLDLTEHKVELRDPRGGRRNVQLTPTEFKLLLVLARAPGTAVQPRRPADLAVGPGDRRRCRLQHRQRLRLGLARPTRGRPEASALPDDRAQRGLSI